MASSFGADIPSIKVEHGGHNGQALPIKQDPDAMVTSPGINSEEDVYEDAGDLDFHNADQNIFLTRIPKLLWESWSKLDDDQEIQIGRIRVEGPIDDPKRMSLRLDPSLPKNKSVPKEYNMHLTNKDSYNTFIFSEKDMPGYSKRFHAEGAPSHWLNRKKIEKKKANISFRKAVPKQTSLIGRVRTEINCLPVENDEYKRITEQRSLLAHRPKQKIRVLEDLPSGNLLNPGTMGVAGDFRNFIDTTGRTKRKGQMLKTARMPYNDLVDAIMDAFKEYTYWPFKVLKNRVQQPEAYLKETLETMAFQAKSGTHMSEWQLKPEYKESTYAQAKDEAAPDDNPGMSFDGASEMDQDDENVDMEDVPLE